MATFTKLDELRAVYTGAGSLVIKDDDSDGRFRLFDSIADYETYLERLTSPFCHHEVVLPELPRRLMFDVDAKEGMPAADFLRMVDELAAAVRQVIGELCAPHEREVAEDGILVFHSDQGAIRRGCHLVLADFMFASCDDIRHIYDRVLPLVPHIRPFIDSKPMSAQFNMRMPNADKKVGMRFQNRPKLLQDNHERGALEGLLSVAVYPDSTLYERFIEREVYSQQREVVGDADMQRALARLALTPWGDAFRVREVQGSHITFDRIEEGPIHCKACGRSHERDNFMHAYVDVAAETIRLCCYKGEAGSKTIETYPYGVGARKRAEPRVRGSVVDEDTFFIRQRLGSRIRRYHDDEPVTFGNEPTIFIRAPMGYGKTEALIEHLRAFTSRRVVFVTFRRTFAASLCATLNSALGDSCRFALYDHLRGPINLEVTPHLIIQAESLHRLNKSCAPDLVVLDESESIISQFSSGNFKHLVGSLVIFQLLVRRATQLIAMDANLCDRTYNVLDRLGRVPVLQWYERASAVKQYVYAAEKDWLLRLSKTLGTRAQKENKMHKRVFISCNSLTQIKRLEAWLASTFSWLTVQSYTSETNQKLKDEHFANINEAWSQFDVVITSPSVSAGVSFTKKHFTHGFSWFCAASCDTETAAQMQKRPRSLSAREQHTFVQPGFESFPTSRKGLESFLKYDYQQIARYENLEGLRIGVDDNGEVSVDTSDPFFTLWVENTRIRNLSRNDYRARLMAQYDGPTELVEKANDPAADMVLKRFREVSDQSAQREAEMVAMADVIDEERYRELADRRENYLEVADSELLELRRYKLQTLYAPPDLTGAFVRQYEPPAMQLRFRNLRMAYSKTISEAIEELAESSRRLFDKGAMLCREEGIGVTVAAMGNNRVRANEVVKQTLLLLHRMGFTSLSESGYRKVDKATMEGLRAEAAHCVRSIGRKAKRDASVVELVRLATKDTFGIEVAELDTKPDHYALVRSKDYAYGEPDAFKPLV